MALRINIDQLYPLTKSVTDFYCGNADSLGFDGPFWPYKLEIVGWKSTPVVVTTVEVMRGGALRIYRGDALTVKIDQAYAMRQA